MKWREKHSANNLNFWVGKPLTPPGPPLQRPSENLWESSGQAWTLGDLPRAGAWAVGVPIPSWKQHRAGFACGARIPGAASPSSPSEAWRRFPGPVPFQPVSILKPGDNERLVSGASVFFFFSFFSTVHAILRNSWASGGGGWRLWNLFLRVATASFSWGWCGLDLLLPWEHTHWSLCTWSRKDRDQGGRQRKSRTGFPRLTALFIAPKMVFVQLSWTFVDVQIWELCS